MCKVYNQVGSLTTIKLHLREHNVNEYRSLKELIDFQKNYSVTRRQIIANNKFVIEQEKNTLVHETVELEHLIKARKDEVEQLLLLEIDKLNHQLEKQTIHSNIILTLINYVKRVYLKLKIRNRTLNFDLNVTNSLKYLNEKYNIKNSRYQFIISCFEDAIMESSFQELEKLDREKKIIEVVNNAIYGALGEQQVVKELEKLPDDFILINDFTCRFNPPIHNRNENYYVNSIQIDHILISPFGVFLIETKNWSQQSIENRSLYSPVQQIKRANFALYNILNQEISNNRLSLNKHHWGDRKIPIKNLIVLINHKPMEEFQYVKVLTLTDLLSYINYFKPSFSNRETQSIANYLLKL